MSMQPQAAVASSGALRSEPETARSATASLPANETEDLRRRTTSLATNPCPPPQRTTSTTLAPHSSFVGDRNGNGNDQPQATVISEHVENGKHVTVVQDPTTGRRLTIRSAERVIGHGSFGVVFQAVVEEIGEVVAIKKVLQDRRYKNRELQIMQPLNHPNVVALKHCFYSRGEKKDEMFLNLVMEYIPETVHRVSRHFSKQKQQMPMLAVKLFIYQLCRSLAYIHSLGICHRDIKPQNLLLEPQAHILKLCDFGSAKILTPGEPNVSYICSRYYRAPELIFGATDYTSAIDVWSAGCVMAELLLGAPLFPGESGVDQLVEIIKILGTPTRQEIEAMNPNYTEFHFPAIRGHPWTRVLRARTPHDAIDLLSSMLRYIPGQRVRALEACAHPFFDELRLPTTRLPNGQPLPPLFNFNQAEWEHNYALCSRLLPPHAGTPPPPPGSSSSSTPTTTTTSAAPPPAPPSS
eukprot:gnl/Spiro4/8123_TR4283_c0_g1_i1.p1 gnl/Spiro4/8123_TR4283_c0_g1~~gnl/Spiro4/8123_TR4283_c0_g1_i1.p1  ORF type:complete len:466 (+),score=66.94 gnl/Spiro4/8123_TR4283_c0_g1_i1:111-1508(+)